MEEKKKRGRPQKTADPHEEKVFPKPDAEIKQKAAEKYNQEQEKVPANDEPSKYQTIPLSNWAQENRKKKLGLKE